MKYYIFLTLLCLLSCTSETSNPNTEVATNESCTIKKYKDPKLEGRDKIAGLKFICEGSIDSTVYLFREKNPFRQLNINEFPISDSRYEDKKDANLFFQKGNADFKLQGETYESLNEKLGKELPSTLSQIGLTRASSMVSSQYDSDFAIVLYYFNLYGFSKPNIESSVHSLSHLTILNSSGQSLYDQRTKDKILTNPNVHKQSNLLYYRTANGGVNKNVQGCQIINLAQGNTILNFELPENRSISAPIINSDDYILFESKRKSYLDLYIYDIKSNRLLEEKIIRHENYTPSKIEGDQLVLINRQNGGNKIRKMNIKTFKPVK